MNNWQQLLSLLVPAVAVLNSRSCIGCLSVGTGLCRHEPNVVERLDHLCTGMLVYCTPIWILTQPLDMLAIVVCMSSSNCWTLTVSIELTNYIVGWIETLLGLLLNSLCTLQSEMLIKDVVYLNADICWTEKNVEFNLRWWMLLTSLRHTQLR